MTLRRRLLRWFLRLGIVLLLTGGGVLAWVGNKAADLVMLPRRTPQDSYHREVMAEPEKFGFHIHPISVPREEGVTLEALYLEALAGPGQSRRAAFATTLNSMGRQDLLQWTHPRGTIVLLHGRNSIKEHWFPVAEKLCAVGFNLILLDSRAHGATTGGYCTYGAKEAGDVEAVLAAVELKWGGQEPLGIMGYSLGGAIAAHLVASEPKFKAVALVSVFSSLTDITTVAGHQRYGSLADIVMPVVRAKVKWSAGFDLDEISPSHDAANILVPTLVVHGENDTFIPPSQGRAIFAALGTKDKQWLPVPGAAHADVFIKGGDDLIDRIAIFFAERLR